MQALAASVSAILILIGISAIGFFASAKKDYTDGVAAILIRARSRGGYAPVRFLKHRRQI